MMVVVRIDVGPIDDVEDMHLVVGLLRAVFNAVPRECEIPVETTIVDADSLDG